MDQDKRLGRLSCCGPNDSQTIPNLNTNTQFGLMHPIKKKQKHFLESTNQIFECLKILKHPEVEPLAHPLDRA